jgi:hypothetical protein
MTRQPSVKSLYSPARNFTIAAGESDSMGSGVVEPGSLAETCTSGKTSNMAAEIARLRLNDRMTSGSGGKQRRCRFQPNCHAATSHSSAPSALHESPGSRTILAILRLKRPMYCALAQRPLDLLAE